MADSVPFSRAAVPEDEILALDTANRRHIGAAPIGVIVGGSLSEGLEMRLAPGREVEDLRVGRFVVVEGKRGRFFAMLSDVILSASHPELLREPPRVGEEYLKDVLEGTSLFATVMLRPMLVTTEGAKVDDESALLPVRTVPAHFSPVFDATRDDVARVFGDEARGQRYFHIGEPLDMDTPVCLDLDRWVERSNGIFGKSGTGKTFLTRLCLCGTIAAGKAVNLIFDMHSEYGWQGSAETRQSGSVRGLKQYFGPRVQIFTLDPESTSRRQIRPDAVIQIAYSQVTPEDVLLLSRELNLTATAVETCHLLERRYRKQWLAELLDMDASAMQAFATGNNAHQGALAALQRKLSLLAGECESFLMREVPGDDDGVQRIVGTLQSGSSVIVEFGQHDRPRQYMLVANILTRRLHERYVHETERAIGGRGAKPLPLVITIEEAHKFLAPELADQTIFGTIAREMRKYNVTLLIVDQRPSGIDDEILSQVGTKLCCLLDDERDVSAVLTGTSGAQTLRAVLASLETRQQALIFGHAVPMPVVVRTREYDDDAFWNAMRAGLAGEDDGVAAHTARPARTIKDGALDFP